MRQPTAAWRWSHHNCRQYSFCCTDFILHNIMIQPIPIFVWSHTVFYHNCCRKIFSAHLFIHIVFICFAELYLEFLLSIFIISVVVRTFDEVGTSNIAVMLCWVVQRWMDVNKYNVWIVLCLRCLCGVLYKFSFYLLAYFWIISVRLHYVSGAWVLNLHLTAWVWFKLWRVNEHQGLYAWRVITASLGLNRSYDELMR